MTGHSSWDILTLDEVDATRQAVRALRCSGMAWAKEFLRRKGISRLVDSLEANDPNSKVRKFIVEKRDFLFELRYAAALADKGLDAEYEYCTGVGESSVDFKIRGVNGNPDWLVELVCLRQSAAVEQATRTEANEVVKVSATRIVGDNVPASDAGEIIKAQERIGAKVWDEKKQDFIKFPEPRNGVVHMLLVNAAGFHVANVGNEHDFQQIVFGGAGTNPVYRAHWNGDPVKGLLETPHFAACAEAVRNRLHVVAFINDATESTCYSHRSLCSETLFFCNQELVSKYPLIRQYLGEHLPPLCCSRSQVRGLP